MSVESNSIDKSDIDWRLTRELRRQALGLEPEVRSSSLQELGSILQSLPQDFVADMRILKKRLAYLPAQHNSHVFAFCSSVSREGTSTLAHALTLAYAYDGAEFESMQNNASNNKSGSKGKVLLVDANLHTPVLHEFMNVSRENGLVDYVEDEMSLTSVTKWMVPNRLALLTAGRMSEFSAQVFKNPRFKKMIVEARKEFQTIIFDCPAVGVHPDILSFLDQIDATILVVKARGTKVGNIMRTRYALEQSGAMNLGVVLNRFQNLIPERFANLFE